MASGRSPENGQVVTPRGAVGQSNGAPQFVYVNDVGSDGWLQTRKEGSPTLVPLIKYTKLQRLRETNDRTFFKVMDGPSAGLTVSLASVNVVKYIGTRAPSQTPARVIVTYGKYVEGWISHARNDQALDQQLGNLDVDDIHVQVTMNTNWDVGYYPLPAGTYTILVPDRPHKADMTRFYRNVEPTLKYDQAWFPIQFGDNSRYVHVGNVSDGCTTVLGLAEWSKIYEALASHRTHQGTSVGVLEVKGTPQRAK